jgi:hypothetical protein
MCHKTVRVSKRYALQSGNITKRYVLHNGTLQIGHRHRTVRYKTVHVTERYIFYTVL